MSMKTENGRICGRAVVLNCNRLCSVLNKVVIECTSTAQTVFASRNTGWKHIAEYI